MALDQTVSVVNAKNSTIAEHSATLLLGLEKVLAVTGGVTSSENTRENHQRVLIIMSDELKSKVSELLSLLENDGERDGKKIEATKVKECVTKCKEFATQLKNEVSKINSNNTIGFLSKIIPTFS